MLIILFGKVIPASKLAEARELELKRTREFEEAAQEEGRHQRWAVSQLSPRDFDIPLTRERFEEGVVVGKLVGKK